MVDFTTKKITIKDGNATNMADCVIKSIYLSDVLTYSRSADDLRINKIIGTDSNGKQVVIYPGPTTTVTILEV